MINIILISTFSLFFLINYLIFSYLNKDSSNVERIKKYLVQEEKENKRENLNNTYSKKMFKSIGEKLNEIVLMKKYLEKLQKNLIQAGILLKAGEFVAIETFVVLMINIILFSLTRNIIIVILVTIGIMFSFSISIKVKRNRRYKLFNDQLADAITLISNSLKVGHSFLQAIQSVSAEMPEPISKEFEKVLKEMKLGATTENSLENLLVRVESKDLELMITAVLIQRLIGGNLSSILDTISETIRERVRLKAEIQTLTAQGRLSGIVVSILPIFIGFVLYILAPDYIKILFQKPIGIFMLIISVTSLIIGTVITKKITQIEL